MDPVLEVVAALRHADVDFVVVGGVAVVLHGHPRMTADLDLIVSLEEDNLRTAMDVLQSLGLKPRLPVPAGDFANASIRQGWVRDRNLTVFSMHDPNDPRREVDLFASMPIPWGELQAQSLLVAIGTTDVPLVSMDHLIQMKRSAGRAQDIADIAALNALRERDRDH